MNQAVPLRVVQLSDIHLRQAPGLLLRGMDTDRSLNEVVNAAMNRHLPELFVLTGDLAEDPLPETYECLRDVLGRTGVPTWCIPGNHDDAALMREELNRDGLATPRAKRAGGWLFVFLDSALEGSAAGNLGVTELAALADLLASYPDEPTLVALHHPPVALGSRWVDELGLEDADRFFEVLDATPQVKAVLWGHAHQVWEGHWEGVRLLGCPSTCFQFLPQSEVFALDDRPPGWRYLELYPDGRIETQVCWLDEGRMQP